jgi:MYXO-CTERM domain-containing protein
LLPPAARSEKSRFIGFGALALAGIGLAVGGRRRNVAWIFFTVLTAVAVVLSLGPEWPLPYGLLYRHVPGFDGMRVPARISVLALMGVSVLAGMGAAGVLSKPARSVHRR